MEPVRNDTTTDRRTAVELAKRLLGDSIWRTAKIEVDGVTFPDTQEIFDGRAPEGMSVDDIVTVNNIKRAWWKRFVQECKYNVGLQSIGSTSANTTASSAKAACATPAACVNTA